MHYIYIIIIIGNIHGSKYFSRNRNNTLGSNSLKQAISRSWGRSPQQPANKIKQVESDLHLQKLAESPAVAVLLFSGMVGNSNERQTVATREVEWASKNILYMESDAIIIPTGLHQSNSKQGRMSVVQNANSLTHRIDLLETDKHRGSNEDQKVAQKKSISTLQIAHAITSAAICEFDNDNNANNPLDERQMSLQFKVIFGVRAWVFVYFCIRFYVLFKECDGIISNVQWNEYLLIFFSAISPLGGGHYWAIHAATPYCDFRRRYYMESKLSMLIHQMEVYSTKDIDAWRRLRLCLQEMGTPYYNGLTYYNAFLIFSCLLYMIIVGSLTVFNVEPTASAKISYSYICVPLVYFCFMIQFWVLLGIRQGSKVNRVAIDHVNEWLKVQQRLNKKIEVTEDELDALENRMEELKHAKQCKVDNESTDENGNSTSTNDDYDAKGQTALDEINEDIQSTKQYIQEVKVNCRKLKSAKDSTYLLCEELNLAITFRGMRMFSMRLSKILFKSLFLLFIYEMYYATIYYLFDGDMSNVMAMSM
jgi:hypothetical protein